MRDLMLLFVVPAALVGCSRAPAPQPSAPPPLYWACGETEFAAIPEPDGVALYLPGREPMVLAPAGDQGFVLNDLRLTYHEDGIELAVAGIPRRCSAKSWEGPWSEAQARGVSIRAVGQEPGWMMELTTGGEIVLALDYGERAFAVTTPQAVPLGGARGWQIDATEHGQVMVLAEDLPCFDVMSGAVHPLTMTVQVGEDRYSGCGVGFE